METLLSFDEEHEQYLWLQVGWQNEHRVHGITLHLRLHNGKIWIEQDWTEDGIATELLKAGVPNNEIVLGFRNPKKRPLTEFAVGYVHQGMNDGYVYIVVVSQCHIVPTM